MKDNSNSKQKFEIIEEYNNIRGKTEKLCKELEVEDYVIQSTYDVSPPKWHLAHTTWFFETFLLQKYALGYRHFDKQYGYLFNSYYQTVSKFHPRINRGTLSRPTVRTVYEYRKYVDDSMLELINKSDAIEWQEIKKTITLGLHHEQQHQELLMMDIKQNFSYHPDFPVYSSAKLVGNSKKFNHNEIKESEFTAVEGGIVKIGHKNPSQFCFDNELPNHELLLKPYLIGNRLVTNGEYLEFIEAGNYSKPEYWLSDGWDCIQENGWQCPLYWHKTDNQWYIFTLTGIKKLEYSEPVSHISYYEADAYARWKGHRLPTEGEWEHAVNHYGITPEAGNFLEEENYHPKAAPNYNSGKLTQFFGDLWEWTSTAYHAYPGFKAFADSFAEYNSKFMCNQFVLRGGCCVTPKSHIRASYRNFFVPNKRWQFSGIRLASDI